MIKEESYLKYIFYTLKQGGGVSKGQVFPSYQRMNILYIGGRVPSMPEGECPLCQRMNVLYARGRMPSGTTVSDGTGRNSLFTGQLLKNLRTPDLEVVGVSIRQTMAIPAQSSLPAHRTNARARPGTIGCHTARGARDNRGESSGEAYTVCCRAYNIFCVKRKI